MKTIIKNNERNIIIKNNKQNTFAVYIDWKIWLNLEEISEIYHINKSNLKKALNETIINSDLDITDNIKKVFNPKTCEYESFYSLDILLLLWYKSKHYSETKYLININNIIKEYANNRKYRTNK